MQVEYQLHEKDYVTHSLYFAGRSRQTARNRFVGRMMVPAGYLVIALLFIWSGDMRAAFSFCVFGLAWYILYPLWYKGYQERHIRGHLREAHEGRFGYTYHLEITDDMFISKSSKGEVRIPHSSIKEVIELADVHYVQLSLKESLILPKENTGPEKLKERLMSFAKEQQIPYTVDTAWKWK